MVQNAQKNNNHEHTKLVLTKLKYAIPSVKLSTKIQNDNMLKLLWQICSCINKHRTENGGRQHAMQDINYMMDYAGKELRRKCCRLFTHHCDQSCLTQHNEMCHDM